MLAPNNPLYRGPETFGVVDDDSDSDYSDFSVDEEEEEEDVTGRSAIDHGSEYAAALGFHAGLLPWRAGSSSSSSNSNSNSSNKLH